MEAKIGPAAFLWPFCPCSGRRLAHRGSCYNFHFLNIFFFFFLHGTKKDILSRCAVWRWRARRAKWQLRFRLLSLQQTNKGPAHGYRVLVEESWFGCSRHVKHAEGLVTWDICEPQDRWGDAPRERKVYFIIVYPIALPPVVSATPSPSLKAPWAWGIDMSMFRLMNILFPEYRYWTDVTVCRIAIH